MSIKVAVVGATGRMGKLALDLIDAAQDLHLHAALDSKSELNDAIGADVIRAVRIGVLHRAQRAGGNFGHR